MCKKKEWMFFQVVGDQLCLSQWLVVGDHWLLIVSDQLVVKHQLVSEQLQTEWRSRKTFSWPLWSTKDLTCSIEDLRWRNRSKNQLMTDDNLQDF